VSRAPSRSDGRTPVKRLSSKELLITQRHTSPCHVLELFRVLSQRMIE